MIPVIRDFWVEKLIGYGVKAVKDKQAKTQTMLRKPPFPESRKSFIQHSSLVFSIRKTKGCFIKIFCLCTWVKYWKHARLDKCFETVVRKHVRRKIG